MLNKRAQILFDQDTWRKLVNLAATQNTSIGELVRDAVEEKYSEEDTLRRRRRAFENILKYRPKPYPGRINYKELINAGRKVY